ncbi:MAG: NusG domain II-containing protein [Clostridia bacterium]|nr:NusG domain II-containing protein [Clostridia bacterium]
MKEKRKFKNDVILVVIVIAVATLGLLLLNLFKTEGEMAAIKIDGVVTEWYPLSENAVIPISTGVNNEQKNTLVIENGEAFIRDANCPDKICEGHRAISFVGETIVCLPHKLVIEIVADDSGDGLDAAV